MSESETGHDICLTYQQLMSDSPVAVSACLLGVPCRYDGQSKPSPRVQELVRQRTVVKICPEVLGGLSIPRPPSGIRTGADEEESRCCSIQSAGSADEKNCQAGRGVRQNAVSDDRAGALVWQGRARLINREGRDVTEEYKVGALRALAAAQEAGVKLAVLKQHSPSCGCGSTGGADPWKRIAGDGVTAALFKAHGIAVVSDEDL